MASGIDAVTAGHFAKDLSKNIQETVVALKEKRYKAKLVRRTYIPKGEGKTRPLGIPVVADKVVQRAAADILEAIAAMMVKELKLDALDGRKWVYYQSPVFEIDEQEAERFDEGLERLKKKYRLSQEEFYIYSHSIIQ